MMVRTSTVRTVGRDEFFDKKAQRPEPGGRRGALSSER